MTRATRRCRCRCGRRAPRRESRTLQHRRSWVRLSPRAALAIAMALHELCTNAAKYGALSKSEGRVTITWSISHGNEARLQLCWKEEGGPPVAPPEEKGFGSRLIESLLAEDLDARIDLGFRHEGVTCVIDTPAAGVFVTG